jgi:signal transduction histidine kinase
MAKDNYQEVVIVLIGSSAVLIAISALMIFVYLFYQKRRFLHLQQVKEMERRFEAELLYAQVEVQEQTRKNLGGELHDNIGQILSLTRVTAGSINLREPERAEQKIADIQSLLARSIQELRRLSKVIHGEQLLEKGLKAMIEQEASWLQKNSNYRVEFRCEGLEFSSSDGKKDLLLYRIVQESLNNVIKHAGADRIEILLHREKGWLHLSISDNGCGFSPGENQGKEGLGLSNMRRRIALLNGEMRIESCSDGTILRFAVPLP